MLLLCPVLLNHSVLLLCPVLLIHSVLLLCPVLLIHSVLLLCPVLQVETEVFDKMDDLVSRGHGDEEYKEMFHDM